MSDLPEHIVKSFESDLARLRDLLMQMGGKVEQQVALAATSIAEGDADAAAEAMEMDPSVDALEHEVEAFVVQILALRQPLAGDLRQSVAALKLASDLERIGDYAANVAKRSIVLAQFSLPFKLTGVSNLVRYVQANLKLAIDAIGEMDSGKAIEVWHADHLIDDIYNAIFRELITYMMEDPRSITPCAHLLFMAKNLERIGDHATNIAETVHFAATGQTLAGNRPKGDNTAFTMITPKF
jgi:phosphate transport system protein